LGNDAERLRRQRFQEDKIAKTLDELVKGACGLLFNTPIDMLIERRIRETIPPCGTPSFAASTFWRPRRPLFFLKLRQIELQRFAVLLDRSAEVVLDASGDFGFDFKRDLDGVADLTREVLNDFVGNFRRV